MPKINLSLDYAYPFLNFKKKNILDTNRGVLQLFKVGPGSQVPTSDSMRIRQPRRTPRHRTVHVGFLRLLPFFKTGPLFLVPFPPENSHPKKYQKTLTAAIESSKGRSPRRCLRRPPPHKVASPATDTASAVHFFAPV